jgi:hypothetical protein
VVGGRRRDAGRRSGGSASVGYLGAIKPGFLHCASRHVRRSEREEKASARSGRNDTFSCAATTDELVTEC